MSVNITENNQNNIGWLCTGHQCETGHGDKVAMRWISSGFERRDYTFGDMDRLSNRFANVLRTLAIEAGEVVFTFLPKAPEQFTAFLGSLKAECITGTLFSNFGDDALLDRLEASEARLVVTRKSLYRKIERIRGRLPHLRAVILTDVSEDVSSDVLSWECLMGAASDRFDTPATAPDTPSVLHYTSGSTGKPKGVLHRHGSIRYQERTTREVLGLGPDDLFWCTADQGWVTGTSYGIIGPWSLGVTQIHFGGGYNARHWFDLLRDERITIWYTAPTALRMLMREGPDSLGEVDVSRAAGHLQRRRTPQPRGHPLGAAGPGAGDPRYLVPDRDRRHHDRQPSRPFHPPRFHGDPARRHRARHPR